MNYRNALFKIAFICAAFASGIAQENRSSDNFLLDRHKAGYLEIGMDVDSVYNIYGLDNIKIVDLQSEGAFSPAIRIFMNGGPDSSASLVAVIECQNKFEWLIHSIGVYDNRFRTKEGIGAGSTLGDLRKTYKVNWIDFGEGPLMAGVEDIEMSFRLDIAFEDIPSEWFKSRDPGLIPDSVKVKSVGLYQYGR
jgi:hypothetical protein